MRARAFVIVNCIKADMKKIVDVVNYRVQPVISYFVRCIHVISETRMVN